MEQQNREQLIFKSGCSKILVCLADEFEKQERLSGYPQISSEIPLDTFIKALKNKSGSEKY